MGATRHAHVDIYGRLARISGIGVAAQPVRTRESAASGSPVEIALPVPDGVTRSAVTGGDLTGRYLSGEAVTDSSPYPRFQPLLWVAGRLHVLPTQDLAPTVLVAVTDVNGHGVAIGARMVDYSSFHTDAWTYRNGRFTLLPGIRPTDDAQAAPRLSGCARMGSWPRRGPGRGSTSPDAISTPGCRCGGGSNGVSAAGSGRTACAN